MGWNGTKHNKTENARMHVVEVNTVTCNSNFSLMCRYEGVILDHNVKFMSF